jgi:predicted nucleotidyltransferase
VSIPTIPLPAHYGREILRCTVGSTLNGTSIAGVCDHDEMGIYVEHATACLGLHPQDHYTTRTARDGERSGPDDTDLTCYSLRKWARLALSGNPTVLALLFAPDAYVLTVDPIGTDLRGHADWFASRRAGSAFLGYMQQQRQRMTGERGAAGRIRRTADGVDWKYAMHMLRLGHQGIEFLTAGRLTLPAPADLANHLRAVRRGERTLESVLTEAEALEAEVKTLLDGASPLMPEPAAEEVEQWMVEAHLTAWGY